MKFRCLVENFISVLLHVFFPHRPLNDAGCDLMARFQKHFAHL